MAEQFYPTLDPSIRDPAATPYPFAPATAQLIDGTLLYPVMYDPTQTRAFLAMPADITSPFLSPAPRPVATGPAAPRTSLPRSAKWKSGEPQLTPFNPQELLTMRLGDIKKLLAQRGLSQVGTKHDLINRLCSETGCAPALPNPTGFPAPTEVSGRFRTFWFFRQFFLAPLCY